MISKIKNLIKIKNIQFFILIFFIFLIPILEFPRIYGKDFFQVIWMANALRNGALFSENTWLINPLSYFGYYPFSHRSIGIPLVLAFITSFIKLISFDIMGISEAILLFDFFLILILYKCSKALGKELFENELHKFLFVFCSLFSFYILNSITMTISTRIVITINMIILHNLNLKLLLNKISQIKAFFLLMIIFLIGSLTHRIWISTIIPIFILLLTKFLQRSKYFSRSLIFFFIPLCIFAFFIGLNLFGTNFLTRVDPNNILKPYVDKKSIIGMIVLYGWYYIWEIGIIFVFFPIGLIIKLYKLSQVLSINNIRNNTFSSNNYLLDLYLILFIIPFLFTLPTIFYSIIIFFPILIIFSIYGLIYIIKYISRNSKKLKWIIPISLILISIIYTFIKIELLKIINLEFILILILLFSVSISLIFIIFKYKKKKFLNFYFDFLKKKKNFLLFTIIISISIFSITTITSNRAAMRISAEPWKNTYLTEEEMEIIEFLKKQNINGLIYASEGTIGKRIGAVGFLPIFTTGKRAGLFIGINLWYGVIDRYEIYKNTEFSLKKWIRFDFFEYNPNTKYYYQRFPLEVIRRKINILNVTIEEDRDILKSIYNIRYIISMNRDYSFKEHNYTLILSLFRSDLEPIFSTKNIIVWKIV